MFISIHKLLVPLIRWSIIVEWSNSFFLFEQSLELGLKIHMVSNPFPFVPSHLSTLPILPLLLGRILELGNSWHLLESLLLPFNIKSCNLSYVKLMLCSLKFVYLHIIQCTPCPLKLVFSWWFRLLIFLFDIFCRSYDWTGSMYGLELKKKHILIAKSKRKEISLFSVKKSMSDFF